ncbi:MAG: bifunctional UDP-N-acetylmuramoyl-tripeptide:D-alanyl-D-alanine ligase/alanine racemase [Sphingobacteriales bacterium]|jgi:alanine racemase|nr:bifunctional UDP-N-acetylmuramoyl-tripeptide:D-alanyl-D-alanine ligase/alanine racemase [Sphingobacteriales bacterium]
MPHPLYSVAEIAAITGGDARISCPEHPGIRELLTDSRKLIDPAQSLFFSILGDRHDGHDYLHYLWECGVRNFVITEPTKIPENLAANYFVVADSLLALQQLVSAHRNRYTVPVIGITGSNGKTIVKEWLYQLLREDGQIVRSPKSYNSQIGVPLSVWQLDQDTRLAVFEAGISQPGEMVRLEQVIRPDIGVFTNIGSAHDENFPDQQSKVVEKLALFTSTRELVYCRDYTLIHDAVSSLPAGQLKPFTWSKKSRADLQVGRINRMEHETEIQGIFRNDFLTIRIPFTDEASIENAIHCWAMMLMMGYKQEVIAARMHLLSPVAMRLEMKEGVNNCSVINDSYNSDLGSLTIALDFMNQQKQHRRRTVILSDILESGQDERRLYADVAALMRQKGVNRFIGIGPALIRQQELFSMEGSFFSDTESFLRELNYAAFTDETVLIKGARSFGFERISTALQQKAHETVLEINLNAVVHNLNLFKSRLKPETKMMVMVKAFSYGSGSFEIANVLQFHRTDYLAVAYADEGVELRKAGITLPIMVMNPEEQSFDAMISYRLEPEVYSFRILSHFTEALRRRESETSQGRFPIHIEFDTGMRRLGFEPDELNELIIRLKNNKHLKVASVFSHLVASEDREHDAFTRAQITLFREMSDTLCSHFQYPILRHILNSSGILRFPEAQFDMVRLGIGLHGVAGTEHEQRQLQPVATLKTTISQIKHVHPGETVGYGRRGTAEREMTIATVGIGYADGLSRKFGNGVGSMFVAGKLAPIVGSVCMDMTMIDVTGIQAREGSEVVVFGQEPDILHLSRQLETIPYEVLTGISERVKRVYFHE